MIKKCIFLMLLLLIFVGNVFAVDPTFIVFYNSGKAVKLVGNKNIVLKKGDQLVSTDRVILPDRTTLSLVCESYGLIQLTTKGTFLVKTLVDKCVSVKGGATTAYFKYIWNSFAHAHVQPDKDPRSYMKTYGASSRGDALKAKINIDTINYYNGTLNIFWQPGRAIGVQLFDSATGGNSIMLTKPLTHLKIDSIVKFLQMGKSYYFVADGAAKNAKRKYLNYRSKENYNKAVQNILKQVPEANTAERAYLTGYMFEEKYFFVEAEKYYRKALKLAPNNPYYVAAVSRFVL